MKNDYLIPLILFAWFTASWFTHVFYCIDHSKWIFLLAGAIFFPIANVHGTGIWFGWFS